jgi:hypothetical protein
MLWYEKVVFRLHPLKGSASTKPNITARGVGKFVTSLPRHRLTSLILNNKNSPYKAILIAIPRNR